LAFFISSFRNVFALHAHRRHIGFWTAVPHGPYECSFCGGKCIGQEAEGLVEAFSGGKLGLGRGRCSAACMCVVRAPSNAVRRSGFVRRQGPQDMHASEREIHLCGDGVGDVSAPRPDEIGSELAAGGAPKWPQRIYKLKENASARTPRRSGSCWAAAGRHRRGVRIRVTELDQQPQVPASSSSCSFLTSTSTRRPADSFQSLRSIEAEAAVLAFCVA